MAPDSTQQQQTQECILFPSLTRAHGQCALCCGTPFSFRIISCLTVWGVEPDVTHHTSWHGSTGKCGVPQVPSTCKLCAMHTRLLQEQLFLAFQPAGVLFVLPHSLLQASHITGNSTPEYVAQPLDFTAIPAETHRVSLDQSLLWTTMMTVTASIY